MAEIAESIHSYCTDCEAQTAHRLDIEGLALVLRCNVCE